MKKRLAEITAERTGKSVEQINADGDRDRWFSAQQALEYGFVDHVRESATDVTGGGGTDQDGQTTTDAAKDLTTDASADQEGGN